MPRNTDETASVESLLAQHFPLHGPYDGGRTSAAAVGLYPQVRYLNYATRDDDGLPIPATVADVAGGIQAAIAGLVQLLTQLDERLQRMANTAPDLYDQEAHDRGDDPAACRQAALRRISTVLEAHQQARVHVFALNEFLQAAHNHLAMLGIRQ